MVRGFLLVLFVSVLFAGCGDELVSYHDFSATDRIVNKRWFVKSHVTKLGTQDLDATVPDSMMTVIDGGFVVNGSVMLNPDRTVTIESEFGFWLNSMKDMKWVVEGDSVIRFTRYDLDGKLVSSIRYNLRLPDSKSMQWYIKATGIETGDLAVIIYNFYLK